MEPVTTQASECSPNAIFDALDITTREELARTVDELKKENAKPKPQWPCLFFRGNTFALEVAQSIAHQLQKDTCIINAHKISQRGSIKKMLEEKRKNIQTVYIVYNISAILNAVQHTASPNVGRSFYNLLKNLSETHLVIGINEQPVEIPQIYRHLFIAPWNDCMNVFSIKDCHDKVSSQLKGIIKKWVENKKIDCVYCPQFMSIFSFKNYRTISLETIDEILLLDLIYDIAAKNSSLSLADYSTILTNISTTPLTCKTLVVNHNNGDTPVSGLRVIATTTNHICDSHEIVNTQDELKYEHALNLDALKDYISRYKVQRQILNTYVH
jgi:hypothetical protein